MRELDAVLQGFLEAEAARLTDAEIACFEGILELPDPALHGYLLGRGAPGDSATAVLIERIRNSARA
jgi:succinate dehydrogenase flavin-adding protein (antitoxin of CptAB toxin-antitoxin module)